MILRSPAAKGIASGDGGQKAGKAMYCVYILRCRDGSLYTGITTDPARRLREHKGELPGGAAYTRAHPPGGYAAFWTFPDRAAASREEARIKALSRREKESLILSAEPVPGSEERR